MGKQPMRVWRYRGEWRWSCRAGVPSSVYRSCTVSPYGYPSPGTADDGARAHLHGQHDIEAKGAR